MRLAVTEQLVEKDGKYTLPVAEAEPTELRATRSGSRRS